MPRNKEIQYLSSKQLREVKKYSGGTCVLIARDYIRTEEVTPTVETEGESAVTAYIYDEYILECRYKNSMRLWMKLIS